MTHVNKALRVNSTAIKGIPSPKCLKTTDLKVNSENAFTWGWMRLGESLKSESSEVRLEGLTRWLSVVLTDPNDDDGEWSCET